jgi:hypothetical protein
MLLQFVMGVSVEIGLAQQQNNNLVVADFEFFLVQMFLLIKALVSIDHYQVYCYATSCRKQSIFNKAVKTFTAKCL